MANITKYTPERVTRLLEAIARGAPYEMAAHYAGIHPSTLYDWLDDNDKPELAEAMKQAEARAAVQWLEKIDAAAEKAQHWTAAAWKLERRYPRDFGQRIETVVVTADHREVIEVAYEEHDPEQDKARRSQLGPTGNE